MTFPTSQTFNRTLLLATLPSLSPPHFLDPVIAHATTHTHTRLVIVLFSRHFNTRSVRSPRTSTISSSGSGSGATTEKASGHRLSFSEHQAVSHTKTWDAVQRILTFTYVQATKIAMDMGKVLMDVDVLLKGLNEDLDPNLGCGMDICFRVSGDAMAVPLPESISILRQSYIPPGESLTSSPSPTSTSPTQTQTPTPPLYHTTALGGTFDHLHAGHKILLSMAAWITDTKLIIGITDDALLQNKSNRDVMESLGVRMERVRDFVGFFKPDIILDIVPITDVFGPTGWDPDIQALVVSKETMSGADAIANHRASKSLPPLHPFLIDVISATNASLDRDDTEWLKNNKLSSTFIRQWIVDRDRDRSNGTNGQGEGDGDVKGQGQGQAGGAKERQMEDLEKEDEKDEKVQLAYSACSKKHHVFPPLV